MYMPTVTLWYAIILIVMGLVGYFGMGRESITALIPAFFGVAVLITALLARKENLRKHSMHAAVVLAVLGVAGTASGIPKFFMLISGSEVARANAVVVQFIMAVLSILYIVLAVKSFIDARRSGPAVPQQ
ncbi:hypothetical protein GF420_08965 [candidate division GN15 bacterium]|nr:hypothetical protein [candidate division GN15 bacterium]